MSACISGWGREQGSRASRGVGADKRDKHSEQGSIENTQMGAGGTGNRGAGSRGSSGAGEQRGMLISSRWYHL